MSVFCKDKKLHSSGLFYTDKAEQVLFLAKIPRLQKFCVAGYKVYRESANGEVMVCDEAERVTLKAEDIVVVELYDKRGLKNGYYRVNRRHFFRYTEEGLTEGVQNEFFFKVFSTISW